MTKTVLCGAIAALLLLFLAQGGCEQADDDADDDDDQQPDPLGLNWIELPAGQFSMGCSPGDADCAEDELPGRTVQIAAFALTDTEITQAQYQALTDDNPSEFGACADCPVEQVSWDQALAFCEAANGRLPSEAEWEYAARGGAATRYYCGDDPACLGDVAWYLDNSGLATHPAGQLAPNAFGLYDMLGNVWEWVADWYAADYYQSGPQQDPAGPADGAERVLRGGSWNNQADYLRVSARNYDLALDVSMTQGFRCARDLEQ